MLSPITGYALIAFVATNIGVPTTGPVSLGNFGSEDQCNKAKEQLLESAKSKKDFAQLTVECVPGVIIAIANVPDPKKSDKIQSKIKKETDVPKQEDAPAE